MRRLVAVAAVVVCAALCAACAQTTPKIAFKHGETRGRLGKNGLRFVVMPDATAELDPAREVVVTLGDRGSLTKAFADAGLADGRLVEPQYK